MRIVDTVWEKDNLGVTSKELVAELGDNIENFVETISKVVEQYVVLKIPAGEDVLIREAQKAGYYFVESIIELEHDLHNIQRGKVLQRLYDSVGYRLMDENDIKILFDEINRGLFSSDRISIDPFFSENLSANRYRNWIETMLKEGAFPYVMTYKNESTGFVILATKDQNLYDSVLGGAYERFRRSGLGIVQKEQEIVKKLGGKKVKTRVSSNNVNQLRALISNGYTVVNVYYVLVRHNLENTN